MRENQIWDEAHVGFIYNIIRDVSFMVGFLLLVFFLVGNQKSQVTRPSTSSRHGERDTSREGENGVRSLAQRKTTTNK